MKIFQFKTRHEIDHPLEAVFAFFSQAENLQKITPDWLHFKILTNLPITMQQGTLIDYRIRMMRITMNWRTEITIWEPPVRFIDTQVKGPYRSWIHEHRFEEIAGKTVMYDTVEYKLSGGPLSGFINKFLVRPQIDKIFAHRKQVIDQSFESSR